MNTRKTIKIGLSSVESSRSRKRDGKLISNILKLFPPDTNALELQHVGEASNGIPMAPKSNDKLTTEQSKRTLRTKEPDNEKTIFKLTSKRISDDFETPEKYIKKAPKTKAKPRPKRQQNIKTAFLKNEELFSAVTAQHCLAENINPDEMQMALALSMSETSAAVIDVHNLDENKEDKTNIRDKLQQFGFRVAEPEEYKLTAFLPTNKKTKWANKFTPLTLRDPLRQSERVNRKVEEFLATQFIINETAYVDERENCPLKSEILLKLLARKNILTDSEVIEQMDLVEFYVLSLFEPSRTKAGHLLKDVHRIAGRERTPRKTKITTHAHYCDPMLMSPAIKKSRNEEVLFIPNLDLPCSEVASCSSTAVDEQLQQLRVNGSLSLSLEPEFGNDKTTISKVVKKCVKEDSVSDNADSSRTANINRLDCNVPNENSSSASATEKYSHSISNGSWQLQNIQREGEVQTQVQINSGRATSPDIFADSDVDMEPDAFNGSIDQRKSSSEHDITTFEIFSSNEVKMSLEHKCNSNDVNHNILTSVIDLTQCESDSNSQHSNQILPSTSNHSFKEKIQGFTFSPTSLGACSQSEQTKIHYFTDSSDMDDIFNSNECSFQEKSMKPKPNCSSFESSGLEDLFKSRSFNETNSTKTEESINIEECKDSENECIILSDDEVNYSIWKADKTVNNKDETDILIENVTIDRFLSGVCKNRFEAKHELSFTDLVADSQPIISQPDGFGFDLETKSNTSFEMDISKRSDFGILEEQSPFKTPTKTPKKTPKKTPSPSVNTKCRRALSTSFLTAPSESTAPLKRFSSVKKFSEFSKSDDDSITYLDDIDKLIYGSPSKKHYRKPTGLDQLLTATISADIESPKKIMAEPPQEFEFNGRIYLVRTTDVQQTPNFEQMDKEALEHQLFKYGIKKSLTRKQATKILEYIFNHTHPYLVDEADIPSLTVSSKDGDKRDAAIDIKEMKDERLSERTEPGSEFTFNFKDCWGEVLLMNTERSLEIKDEQYILQTNTNKKTATALLPFHIAWYNLVQSNKKLHEAILHYEPIDLQEIYLFFKGLGYRYDPKELKYFFDSRSIIFRYDLNKSDPSGGANRHVRKNRKQLKQRCKNNKNS